MQFKPLAEVHFAAIDTADDQLSIDVADHPQDDDNKKAVRFACLTAVGLHQLLRQ